MIQKIRKKRSQEANSIQEPNLTKKLRNQSFCLSHQISQTKWNQPKYMCYIPRMNNTQANFENQRLKCKRLFKGRKRKTNLWNKVRLPSFSLEQQKSAFPSYRESLGLRVSSVGVNVASTTHGSLNGSSLSPLL